MKIENILKTIEAHFIPSAVQSGIKFNMVLGKQEVMVLKGITYHVLFSPAVGNNIVSLGLYRKSDKDPIGSISYTDDSDVVWAVERSVHFVTETVDNAFNGSMYFAPDQIILIRPPRLVAISSVSNYGVQMRLYYLIKQLSKESMAKLMLKDHE